MNIQSVIEQLGYSDHEAKLYLASLKTGESNIADLAHIVQMPRSTVKELLDGMQLKGLVNYYEKHGRKYWVAENPEKLMNTLKERETTLGAVLPELKAVVNNSRSGKPNIRLYTGIEEIKLIMDDIIDSKRHVLALVSEDDFRKDMGEDYMDNFIERRKQHFLNIKFIGPHSERTKVLKSRDSNEARHTRFLPEHVELRRVSNFIYGDKVALISLNQKEPTGIVIEDPNIARAMSIYFDSLWHHSSEN